MSLLSQVETAVHMPSEHRWTPLEHPGLCVHLLLPPQDPPAVAALHAYRDEQFDVGTHVLDPLSRAAYWLPAEHTVSM